MSLCYNYEAVEKVVTLKIYLDTKDYIRIAEGILGNKDRTEDYEGYKTLLGLVKSDQIKIYFSWCHFYEALKYKGQNRKFLETYCDVIDSLTQGNCIIWPQELDKRELEIFFAESFNFTSSISRTSYPYGKDVDAIIDGGFQDLESPLKLIIGSINNLPIPLGKKFNYIRALQDPMQRKKILKDALPNTMMEAIKKDFPNFEGKCSKKTLLDIFDGSEPQVKERFFNFFRTTFTFKNILLCYQNKFPRMKQLSSFWDADEAYLIQLIKDCQTIHSETGVSPIKKREITEIYMMKIVNSLEGEISTLSTKYGFDASKAKDLLIKDGLKSVLNRYVAILSFTGYLQRNKGANTHGSRFPRGSDLRDIFHSIAIPYVDYYVTDRFFVSIAKKYADVFNTRVLPNIQQLKEIIIRR